MSCYVGWNTFLRFQEKKCPDELQAAVSIGAHGTMDIQFHREGCNYKIEIQG